ncbi:LLM class flavin-dependent oxidoreductase [Nocardia farcinica]|uniref:LLM class flavin-dependent oxidoreductase n=1 Tax=Nocardia farcinica TaxID=37329 RepID=UPI001E502B2E|nr:LLM class flavin-dependent oxidoreductase [Nocardia farcinica]
MSPKQFHLNAFLMGVGHHEAAWRHPRTDEHQVLEVAHFQELARIAERGKLDSVFFADGLAVGPRVERNTLAVFEPVTLLSAIAAVTSRIGLIATASTSYHEPYNLARKFTSLDHISKGRAGWNIVTSAGADEAANFGLDGIPDHAGRYERAREFLDVTLRLWDSWESDAVVLDPDRGVFADPAKVHTIDYDGPRFRVRGPLNSPRSPQGRPLLVQAGSSESGKDFAARYAEAVFTAQRTLADGQAFYRDLKARVAAHGRAPEDLKVLPGLVPYIADTERAARELEREFTELISPDYALGQLSRLLGVDLTAHALDAPLPALPDVADFQGNKSREGAGGAGAADGARADRQARRWSRAPVLRRDAGAGRRRTATVVRERRRRRLQHHAAVPAGRADRLRRQGGADPAGTRAVPHRVRGRHPARTLRARARGEPVRGPAGRGERVRPRR